MLAVLAGAALGAALVIFERITRADPVDPVPARAMRALIEREASNTPDGTP